MVNNNKLSLQDKDSILYVLGAIMREPSILGNNKEYPLSLEDFPESFHKVIYGTMENLYKQTGGEIKYFYPEEVLRSIANTSHKEKFLATEGDKYLLHLSKLQDSGSFDYHYKRIRKFTFLRTATSLGFDMTDIYDPNELDIVKAQERNEAFDEITLEQLIGHLDRKNAQLHAMYNRDSVEDMNGHMGKNIDHILADVLAGKSYGTHLISTGANAITFGINDKRLYCVSAPTGHGKSRIDFLVSSEAFVELYDTKKKEWVKRTPSRRVLYLGTELTEDQIKIPMLASISGVDEDKIKQGSEYLTQEEIERLYHAVDVMKRSPLWFVHLGNFDLQDIEYEINKHIVAHQVDLVVFDYIHTSLKLFTSLHNMGARGLGEHQILYQLVTRIKDFTNKYNIPIFTNTQVNDRYKEGIYDETTLQGAKAIAQKLDYGSIMVELQAEDYKLLEELQVSNPEIFGMGFVMPNMTINWYKTRDSRHARTRQWVHFDRGIMRITDCFFTDYQNKIVNITKKELLIEEDGTEYTKYQKYFV